MLPGAQMNAPSDSADSESAHPLAQIAFGRLLQSLVMLPRDKKEALPNWTQIQTSDANGVVMRCGFL